MSKRAQALGNKLQNLLAMLAGALSVAAFAPLSLSVLAVLGLLGLFLLIPYEQPRRAAWRGFYFGLGLFGVGTSWVVISIHEFGHSPLPLAVVMTLLMVVYLALFPALFAWAMARTHVNTHPWRFVLLAPALWVVGEWLRGSLFTGFPWLNIGYSQMDTWLAGYAPLLGIYGLGALVVTTAALLFVVRQRPVRATVCLLALWGGGLALQSQEWVGPSGAPIRVSLLQGNVSQHEKWQPEVRARTLSLYEQLTEQHLDSDLIIWPETAVPAFYHAVAENYLADILNRAGESQTDLLIGVPIRQASADPERPRYYNSVVALGGQFAVYHKQHLVPFGEYVPLGDVLRSIGGVFNLPMSDFSSGGLQAPLNVAGQQAAITICYEIIFAEEVRKNIAAATLLVNVSNDAWFGRSLAPPQHFEMARMRALETGRPLLRATNTGITAFVDHRGRVQQQAPTFSVQVLSGSVQPMQGVTPYVRYGNAPVMALALLSLLSVLSLAAWRERHRAMQ
ncbi:apolipoprotein N-acyltransferase [Sulfuriflexus mobilis]|uniref:apolipoprotein N-acyltransferase n=1 Tax=Sulfuriflexus mobilis TaxID=1811807 RepID=UPI00155999C1|nr:apolipoprotein N-acyltransferase [Sulfuriflexus mobilis]